jgi:DNA-binding beta-propeller fold protein YncE
MAGGSAAVGGANRGGAGGSGASGSGAGGIGGGGVGGSGAASCQGGLGNAGADAGATDAGAVDGGDPFVLDRNQCARNWQIAFTAPATGSTAPSRDFLRVGGGRIFLGNYVSNGKFTIASLTPGGTANVVHEGAQTGIWLDGGSLVYSEDAALFTIPQSGGPPDPGVVYATNIYQPSVFDRALDAHFVYWFQHEPVAIGAPYELWRLARNGGVEELLFSFTEAEVRQKQISGIQVLGDYVLVYGMDTTVSTPFAWSVSTRTNRRSALPVLLSNPGDPTPTSGYTTLLGASDDGALLWTRPFQTLTDMGSEPYRSFIYALGSVSGGALVPFDVKLPPRAIPLAAWPAGSGAWYLAATEEPQTDHVLVSVWWVDATGRASRIGCDPVDWSDAPGAGSQDHRGGNLISAADVTPAGLTLAISYPAGPWTIVSVPNPNIPPVPSGCSTPDASSSDASDGGVDRPPSTCASDPTSECQPGATQTQACGSNVGACKAGTQSRTCTESCLWPAWSSCGGAGYLRPSAEVCGDGVDNDCNGGTDDGCACKPVAPGSARSFAVSGTIVKLVAHPSACLMFGLNAATPSEVVVFDTAMKKEVTRVALGAAAVDLDLSPNGQHLVAGFNGLKQVAAIDTSTFALTSVPTSAGVWAVAVDDAGNIYYWDHQGDLLHRMNLAQGSSSDVKLVTPNTYEPPALQLSADGGLLYFGGQGTTASNIYSLNVSGGGALQVSAGNWQGVGSGFALPPRYLYLGPSGKNVYYDGFQLDAAQLTFVRGPSGIVLAEDAAGSVAASTAGIIDARLLTRLSTFAAPVAAGALTASDHELWTFDKNAGVMTCANLMDLVGGKTLGVRESAPGLLANHGFAKLVADPKRPRLYGLDTLKQVVVEIDPATGAALRQVLVGSGPTDLDIDPTGTFLYAGHTGTQGLAQLDAESLTFKRFIPTRYVDFDVAPLGVDRIAVMDAWEWTTPSLIDVATGTVLDSKYGGRYEGQLAATSDGKALFVADNPGITSPVIVRYDVSAGKLQQVSKSSSTLQAGASARTLLATPDGTSVFYAGQCLNGIDLTQIRYPQPDRILSVAPNSLLAASSSRVYRVSDGTPLATVPGPCPVQAFSRDSGTLYCTDAGFLTSLDVRALK